MTGVCDKTVHADRGAGAAGVREQGGAGGDPSLGRPRPMAGRLEQPPPLCPSRAGILGAARVSGDFCPLGSTEVTLPSRHPR